MTRRPAVATDGLRLFAGPANPGVPHRTETFTDPALHARISAAVDLVFARVDPEAVYDVPAPGGAGETVTFGNAVGHPGQPSAIARDFYRAECPGWAAPFRRFDYRRAADGVLASLIAREDGETVTFLDDLGPEGTLDGLMAALEWFAARDDPAGWGRGAP